MTPPNPSEDLGKGRALYAAYIKEQLDAQEARKDSFEKRGLAVITTSGLV